ncbi:MAG: cytochrome c biogenesis protein CcdA [Thermobifida fusca]|nr:cytochrome c biogenesis protein CcdA [Thermobifida fusca]
MGIGYVAAFAGGALALFSPCSALLLPSFFAYAFRSPVRLLARTGVFFCGLCATLVPLGSGSALVSTLFYGHRDLLITVAGAVIIAFGVVHVVGGGWSLPFFGRWQSRVAGRTDVVSVFGLGAVYGLAGFWSGPVLGAVLTVAATGTVVQGAMVLACYALGMAAPLFVLAVVWERCGVARKSWLRGRAFTVGPLQLHSSSVVSGVLFIAIGVLFVVYDGTASLSGLAGMAWWEEVAYRAQGPLLEWDSRVDSGVAVIAVLVSGVLLLRAWVRGKEKESGGSRRLRR